MLPLYCKKRLLLLGENLFRYLQHSSKHNARTGDGCDEVSLLLRLCEERHFISANAFHTRTCIYGPLGTELKKNILEQWWTAAIRSRARVFGINTSVHTRTSKESVMIVNNRTVQENVHQNSFTTEEALRMIFQNSMSVRSNLLQGECRKPMCFYQS